MRAHAIFYGQHKGYIALVTRPINAENMQLRTPRLPICFCSDNCAGNNTETIEPFTNAAAANGNANLFMTCFFRLCL
jgi:hypothetical protein